MVFATANKTGHLQVEANVRDIRYLSAVRQMEIAKPLVPSLFLFSSILLGDSGTKPAKNKGMSKATLLECGYFSRGG